MHWQDQPPLDLTAYKRYLQLTSKSPLAKSPCLLIRLDLWPDNATTSDKTLEAHPPALQYQRHNWTPRVMYKLPPSPPPYNVVLAILLTHTNHVVFKTTLKDGRGEDRYLCSNVRGLIKNNRKIRLCFQSVASSFVWSCSSAAPCVFPACSLLWQFTWDCPLTQRQKQTDPLCLPSSIKALVLT